MLKAEAEVHLDDESAGGQQDNLMLELQRNEREERARLKAVAHEPAKARAEAEKEAVVVAVKLVKEERARLKAVAHELAKARVEAEKESGTKKDSAGPSAEDGDAEGEKAIVTEDPTMVIFKKAAAALAEKRMEEAMAVDERIVYFVQKWSKEWGEDLERRPEEVKESGSGYQSTLTYRQTMKYLEPLYERLKARSLHDELRTGMWMMVSAMKERNYLYANDIYIRLAVGTAAWPIGVTQVGIHERSAREKISHSMNSSGSAHIMNDEATRKFLQAIKRIITFVQRAYPTDPSRSIDFQTSSDLGRGVAGAGSDRMALLEAEAKGEDWRSLGMVDAPHCMDRDGSVLVPTKWQYILQRGAEQVEEVDAKIETSRAKAARIEAGKGKAAK
eukprot:gene10079-7976_t